jgi:hypothetical protein
MQMQFLIGMNDREIHPQRSKDDTCSHYAWCLEQLIAGLDEANKDEANRRSLLAQFETNMNLSPGTSKMLDEVATLFASLMKMNPLPSNEYIINCLMGLPVGDERFYIHYNRDLI